MNVLFVLYLQKKHFYWPSEQTSGLRGTTKLKTNLTILSLSLLDSYTVIPGSPVRHVDVGSVLNITCLVVNFPLKLDYIIFYHNDKVKHGFS